MLERFGVGRGQAARCHVEVWNAEFICIYLAADGVPIYWPLEQIRLMSACGCLTLNGYVKSAGAIRLLLSFLADKMTISRN